MSQDGSRLEVLFAIAIFLLLAIGAGSFAVAAILFASSATPGREGLLVPASIFSVAAAYSIGLVGCRAETKVEYGD